MYISFYWLKCWNVHISRTWFFFYSSSIYKPLGWYMWHVNVLPIFHYTYPFWADSFLEFLIALPLQFAWQPIIWVLSQILLTTQVLWSSLIFIQMIKTITISMSSPFSSLLALTFHFKEPFWPHFPPLQLKSS